MRIMGLDYGAKTVGVAVCDPLGFTAQAVETIVRKEESKLRRTCRRIEELIREYEITSIVLGYPKNMMILWESVQRRRKSLKRCWKGGQASRSFCGTSG